MSDANGSGPNRTVFRPSPLQAGNTALPPERAHASAAALRSAGRDDIPKAPFGFRPRNELVVAATPLLALLGSVRTGRAQLALKDLHARCASEIEAFQTRFNDRLSADHLKRAVYGLACTADDVGLNLPGQSSQAAQWAQRSLVVRFFNEAIGGDGFWRRLEEMVGRPHEFQDLLELYHACMAAGFEGRFRVEEGGRQALADRGDRVYRTLEHARAVSASEVAPHWRGVEAPSARVGLWTPLVLAAAAAGTILLVVYVVLRLMLAQTGADAMTALRNLTPHEPLRLSRAAPVEALPPSTQAERIATFLAPEIAQGLVAVLEDGTSVRVRTTVGQLFKSGSDQLLPERRDLFERIGLALNTEPGPVRVEGYTDSAQPRGLSFPDNVALSQGRAETAAAILRGRLQDPSRVTADGKGEADPVGSNDTAAGMAQNRRVEVVVERRD